MSYEPNFADPRIQRRVKQALTSVELYMKPGQIHPVSKTQQYKFFGNTSRPLGSYLKQRLLIVVDDYYNIQTGVCKKYSRNDSGILEIKQQTGLIDYQIEIKEDFNQQTDSGQFEYKEINGRIYHPLQNLPKRIKRPYFSQRGYSYEYDICCCAQTVLIQYAEQLNLNKPISALREYTARRHQIRNQLALELGVKEDVVKQILHAILFGGTVSTWHTNQIYSYVNYNSLKIKQIKENLWIQQYQADVRDMWKSIRPSMQLSKGIRFNSRKKSQVYRDLEQQVREVIERYLKKTKNDNFFEHDGWTCRQAVDISELTSQVRRTTGFVIELDWTIIEYTDATNNTATQQHYTATVLHNSAQKGS